MIDSHDHIKEGKKEFSDKVKIQCECRWEVYKNFSIDVVNSSNMII